MSILDALAALVTGRQPLPTPTPWWIFDPERPWWYSVASWWPDQPWTRTNACAMRIDGRMTRATTEGRGGREAVLAEMAAIDAEAPLSEADKTAARACLVLGMYPPTAAGKPQGASTS